MSQPAARISDLHTCPMATPGTPPIPHVGGPILPPGEPRVMIGGLPAARVGDMCTCVGPPDSIVKGSLTVLIGGRPAARMGDNTAHGGVIVAGFPTVMIGDPGSGAGGGAPLGGLAQQGVAQKIVLENAASNGSAFCEVSEPARRPEGPPESAPQRTSLLLAAQTGVPFCEECAKAAREAAGPVPAFVDPAPGQRQILKQAAADGVPFCEECAKAAAAAGP